MTPSPTSPGQPRDRRPADVVSCVAGWLLMVLGLGLGVISAVQRAGLERTYRDAERLGMEADLMLVRLEQEGRHLLQDIGTGGVPPADPAPWVRDWDAAWSRLAEQPGLPASLDRAFRTVQSLSRDWAAAMARVRAGSAAGAAEAGGAVGSYAAFHSEAVGRAQQWRLDWAAGWAGCPGALGPLAAKVGHGFVDQPGCVRGGRCPAVAGRAASAAVAWGGVAGPTARVGRGRRDVSVACGLACGLGGRGGFDGAVVHPLE
jgi:hypothetical protein